MDQSNIPRPTGLPRPSRLPVPRSTASSGTVRASPSRENLNQQQPQRTSVPLPRLRNTPSRDQLSSSTSSRPASTSRAPVLAPLTGRKPSSTLQSTNSLRKSNSNALLRKQPSRQALQEIEPFRSDSSDEIIHGNGGFGGEEAISSRRHRPSLSERTMETLQNIPSSPVVRKKRESNFFNPESPMRPPSQASRPGSSYQSDSSIGLPVRSFSSRPSSSSGNDNPIPLDFRASTNTFRPPQSTLPALTPVKRSSIIKSLKTPSDQGLVQTRQTSNLPPIKSGSKTLSSRQLKPRGSLNGLFRKPSMPTLNQSAELDRIGFGSKTATLSISSSDATSTTSKASRGTAITSVSQESEITPRKSSSALRDQIAKAKAAKRAAAAKQASSIATGNEDDVPVMPTGTFDFGLANDPFNQNIAQNSSKGLLKKRIDSARTDGRLNIAAMGFREIPKEVIDMYNLEAIGSQGGSWAESVDLTRFIAADNDFELISDDVFPDIDPREAVDNEEFKGNQFGGLETLDLHGNVLIALPQGLRRLELLTTLNLSNNKLGNDAFEVISQMPSLRDLNIAGNGLVGTLDEGITKLVNLETLDLQRNSLATLPDGLADLARLRVLNLTANRFVSLPFELLRQLPLIELLAAKNTLEGTLIADGIEGLPHLQVLDITSNALTSLSESAHLNLPALHQLNCSSNRLTNLPDMTSWICLLNLAAEDNQISAIPQGFTTLQKLKNVNLNGNNIKVLDDRIGLMDNLDIFRVGGNPLRDKKFSVMSTEDLKRAMKARIEPEEQVEKTSDDGFYSAHASPNSTRSPSSEWPVKMGGVLDRSNTQSHSLNPVAAADVAATNAIKALELHHNMFKEIPSSIAFFAASLTTLSMAHNELAASNFMVDDLELPALKELNLSSNTFNSVQPLIQHLTAPNLEKLDISFNRLTSLPPLKHHFPKLWTVLASNNTIKELLPDSIKGLRVLDCSSNDINSLNARIGLLGGPGGLEMLNVSGNRFRVPKYTILEKGTEATLAWLRDRIPAGDTSPTDVD